VFLLAYLNSATAKHTRGKEDDGLDQFQYASHSYTHDPERKQKQPNQGIEKEGEQRKGPANNEKNAPQQKTEHKTSAPIYVPVPLAVPAVMGKPKLPLAGTQKHRPGLNPLFSDKLKRSRSVTKVHSQIRHFGDSASCEADSTIVS
jgi:hypothetical protein